MTRARTRNLLRAPIVLLIRVPILLPLWCLSRIGSAAEAAGEWLSSRLPGFEREK